MAFSRERGATLLDYVVVVSLVALIAVAGLVGVRRTIQEPACKLGSKLTDGKEAQFKTDRERCSTLSGFQEKVYFEGGEVF